MIQASSNVVDIDIADVADLYVWIENYTVPASVQECPQDVQENQCAGAILDFKGVLESYFPASDSTHFADGSNDWVSNFKFKTTVNPGSATPKYGILLGSTSPIVTSNISISDGEGWQNAAGWQPADELSYLTGCQGGGEVL